MLGHGGFRKRIVEMGFIKGKTVEVLLNAPLRDPIKYKVMGYEISLRRQEAEMIEIISEQEAKEQAVQPDYHEGLGENMHLGEDELKQLALGKRRTINVAWWEIQTVVKLLFSTSLPARTSMWAITVALR